ncbi:TPA: restriction endonuclease subunit S [Neisseria subflava]
MIFNQSKLNKHWKIMALSELGDFNRGKSKHRPRNDPKLFQNGIYPFIQTGDIKEANLYLDCHTENYNEFGLKQSKLWKENTLCITIAANIAETALLKYPMCFPDSVVGFTAYEGVSSELFMHYIFTFIKKSIQSAASGSIQDNINIDFLTKLKFRIPSKIEQDKIAAVLSALDKKIALNKQINARLEEMAKTLYDYWFVQFDFPDANGKPYKSSGGEMVFDETLKREIPKGWEVKSLNQVADIVMGQSPDGASYNLEQEGTIFFQGSTDFDWRFPNVRQYTTSPTRFAQKGDILLSVRAPVGDLNISSFECCIGRGLAALRSKSGNNSFLFYVMKYFKTVFERRNTEGTTFGSITKDDLHSLKLVAPADNVLEKYNEIASKYDEMIFIRSQQNHQLTQLRDFLLPMLMNGQVSMAE